LPCNCGVPALGASHDHNIYDIEGGQPVLAERSSVVAAQEFVDQESLARVRDARRNVRCEAETSLKLLRSRPLLRPSCEGLAGCPGGKDWLREAA
jgi:hypothetical protein